jgi:hypothetical protein
LSRWSPTSWPSVSLMRLKASRSMNSTANFLLALRERAPVRLPAFRGRPGGWGCRSASRSRRGGGSALRCACAR